MLDLQGNKPNALVIIHYENLVNINVNLSTNVYTFFYQWFILKLGCNILDCEFKNPDR